MATILIVDYKAVNREVLVVPLRRRGHRLLEASDATAGLALAQAEHPDAVITDVLMPAMDGYEFARRLHASPQLAGTVVIFSTEHYRDCDAERLAGDCGVHYLLPKPCEPQLVLDTLERALGASARLADGHLKQVSAKLGESASALKRAQRMARLGHVITGPDGTFEAWSESLPLLVGVAPEAMPLDTRGWLELVHPDDRALFRAVCIEAATQHGTKEVEYRIQCADGAVIHLQQALEPLDAHAQGRWFNTIQDITERKRAAEAAARLAAIVESSDDAIVGKSLAGIVTSWNAGAQRLFGYAAGEMIGKPILVLIPRERAGEEAEILARVGRGERIEHFETVRRRKDGRLIDVSVSISPVLDAEGRVVGASKIARDLSELALTTRRIVTLQEKERRDIARELHDRIGQSLAALGVNLARMEEANTADLAERIAESRRLVEQTGVQIQDVLTEIKPPMLANYGLADALRWHGREFSRRTGIAVEVDDSPAAQRLSPEVEMALFRIAQAALNNVAQHAAARRVRVALEREPGRIEFRIEDDGRGFDAPAALAAGRWGLTAMRERAEAIGGELRIDSAPGRGSRILVSLDTGA